MVDVFIATIAREPIRNCILGAVVSRWKCESEINLRIFDSQPGRFPHEKGFFIEWEKMQRSRRIFADQMAESEIYVLTDDDCMPLGVDFIARGLAVMQAHPEFGILAAMNVLNKNDAEPYTGKFIDDDVWECHAVGGIRFCRKGIIKEWPESVDPGSYDMQHHEALVKAGYKAGYMRRVQFNHLGIGLSSHWPPGNTEIEQLERVTA